jgi:hypothetical protein
MLRTLIRIPSVTATDDSTERSGIARSSVTVFFADPSAIAASAGFEIVYTALQRPTMGM